MTLRGKDYCNCEHAQLLRKAIEDACDAIPHSRGHELSAVRDILNAALDEDHAACMDLWGDLKEAGE